MEYIDLHAHMVSRTTDDYQQMALTGCVALTEPAFWPGWDRGSADGWAAAHVADGADPGHAAQNADATYGFYTGAGL